MYPGYNFACAETGYNYAFGLDPVNTGNYNYTLEGFAWFKYSVLANVYPDNTGPNALGRIAENNKNQQQNNNILIVDNGESFQITIGENCNIKIFDMIGNLVYNANMSVGTSSISKVGFANGIYILNAISATNFISKKISVIK